MKVDFVIDGELAKEAFHIPRSMDSALKNGTPLSFYVGHRLWWRRMVNIWDLLPSHLRSPRTLILSVVLLGIVTYVIGNFAEEQFQEAKLEREAPADEAEVRQELFSYQKQKGYAIAVQMWQARAGGLAAARTEGEIEHLANYIWDNPTDLNLQGFYSGWIKSDVFGAKDSFIAGFVRGYEDQIRDYNHKNQPLY
jgi:hypothetical protein